MPRKKQEENEEVLSRHPHADADEIESLESEFDSEFVDQEEDVTVTDENVEETETTEEINAEEVEVSECVAESENQESKDENDETNYDQADKEFMDSVTAPKKAVSPAQVKAKTKALVSEIDDLQERVEVLEQIENLKKHIGWEYAIEDLKDELCRFVEAEKVDNLKKSTKGLEAALAAREFLGKFSSELYSKKCEIKSKEKEIEELKKSAIQIGLFDSESETETETDAEVSEETETEVVVNEEVEEILEEEQASTEQEEEEEAE